MQGRPFGYLQSTYNNTRRVPCKWYRFIADASMSRIFVCRLNRERSWRSCTRGWGGGETAAWSTERMCLCSRSCVRRDWTMSSNSHSFRPSAYSAIEVVVKDRVQLRVVYRQGPAIICLYTTGLVGILYSLNLSWHVAAFVRYISFVSLRFVLLPHFSPRVLYIWLYSLWKSLM